MTILLGLDKERTRSGKGRKERDVGRDPDDLGRAKDPWHARRARSLEGTLRHPVRYLWGLFT